MRMREGEAGECRFMAGGNEKRVAGKNLQPFLILVPLTGIELVTFALRMRCSTD